MSTTWPNLKVKKYTQKTITFGEIYNLNENNPYEIMFVLSGLYIVKCTITLFIVFILINMT